MGQPVLFDRILQRLCDMRLPDQVVKCLRAGIFWRRPDNSQQNFSVSAKARKVKDEGENICAGMELEKKVVDQLSVFFLSQGDQTAESVMKRLTDFIDAARESLDFAIYDMRLSDSLKQMFLHGAPGTGQSRRSDPDLLRRRQAAQSKSEPGAGPCRTGHERRCGVVRLSLASDRRDEIDASQVHRARRPIGLDRLAQHDR